MKISIRFLTLLSLSLAFVLTACSDGGGGSSQIAAPSAKYGDSTLPELSALPEDYLPQNLNNKVFESEGLTFVPVDIRFQNLTMTFDAQAKTFEGAATIYFYHSKKGRPYFQLNGLVTKAMLDGETVSTESIQDPDGLNNRYLSIEKDLAENQFAVLEIEYALPEERFTFASGGVSFLTNMTDLSPGRFFENWAPVGFEDDSFSLSLKLKIKNSDTKHRVFSNGTAARTDRQEWNLSFPSHFTASSFYIHLTYRDLIVKEFMVPGIEKQIPVTVYGSDAALVEKASAALPGLFAELEKDFGAYAHTNFTAYMHSGGGGMEYAGATITGFSALDHELFHSWFARGVMPAEGRSGWIDEAFASWRDNGYFQASSLLSRTPTVLAGFSPFRKSTPSNCYKDGRHFVAELDVHLAPVGGMKKLMKLFYERYRHRVVTTEEFSKFLVSQTGTAVDPFFNRYIYGGELDFTPTQWQAQETPDTSDSLHPSPLTPEEILSLR